VSWTKKGLNETTGRLLTKLDEVESAIIVVDEPGLGGGVIDRLEEQGVAVNAYNGGRRPEFLPNPNRFLNLRAAAYWMLRQRLEDGELALPPDDRLADELTTIRWRVNSSGQIALEPKDRVRERLGRSPDAADALAAAVWVQEAASAPVPSAEIVWDPAGLFSGPDDWAVT
jgi:hypothetical protein